MITIPLGQGQISTIHGYSKLIAFYEACKKYNNEEILISFEELTWFDGNMSALLQAILHKLAIENKLKFFANREAIDKKFDILIRNGFLTTFGNRSKTGSEISLTGFYPTEDEKFVDYVENKLLRHPNLPIAEADKSGLRDSLFEVFGNVDKHARTEHPIYACGQYYPTKQKLGFTLVDLGVGYLDPIREFTSGKVKTASEAILWALRGNSSLKGTPGGIGLRDIQKFCRESGSFFGITSGGAYWTNTAGGFMRAVEPFCGTVVNLIFKC